MQPADVTNRILARSRNLGFTLGGVCPAVSPPGAARLDEWLDRGYAGDMAYIATRRDAYQHPRHVLEGVRSIVMLATPYGAGRTLPTDRGEGRVARYAWGAADYHDVIRQRLHELADYLRRLAPTALTRGVVDTAPLLEREFAQLAGLGWVGKNTLLLNKSAGSYFFLAALLTDLELVYDAPHATDHCGTCTACLDACPTAAFPQPYVLDASRCVSYLTIERRGPIPNELRQGIGEWLFGCDVCQLVCPWNRRDVEGALAEFAPLPEMNPVALAELFDLTEDDFRRRFRRTPLWRSHRRGLLRNAAVVLGNQRHPDATPALAKGLDDCEPLVRGAAAWALGQIAAPPARALLEQRQRAENDPVVLEEIAAALADIRRSSAPASACGIATE